MSVDAKIEIEESKTSIMLPTGYRHWAVGAEKGKFSSTMNWQEIKVNNRDNKAITVQGTKYNGKTLPEICFKFCQENGNVRVQLQNSDKIINARIISASRTESNGGKVFLPGEYKFFSGEILVRTDSV